MYFEVVPNTVQSAQLRRVLSVKSFISGGGGGGGPTRR